MKFQNPSLNFFLNGRKDGRTNERTSQNQYAPHFFKVGGIKRKTQTTTIITLRWPTKDPDQMAKCPGHNQTDKCLQNLYQ